jgi:hypothetical protein
MMTRLNVSAGVTVGAGQDQVWELAVDWGRQREWILGTRVEGGRGLGAKVSGRTGIGPVGFTDPMLITEWSPPHRCTVTHQGKIVRGAGIFEVRVVDLDGPRSEFRWTEQIELPLPPAIGRPLAMLLVAPVTRAGLAWSMRRFARLIGTGTGPDQQLPPA